MNSEIEKRIKSIVGSYIDMSADEISMDASLGREYEMDSTEITELAKIVEKAFGVAIAKTDRKTWKTVGDICQFISAAQPETA